MNIKKKLITSNLGCALWLMREFAKEARLWFRFANDHGTYKDKRKLQADLSIRIHALEKGMSIGNARMGFGQLKAKAIIGDLGQYIALGGDATFVTWACSVIAKYISFNHFDAKHDISVLFGKFCNAHDVSPMEEGGITYLKAVQPNESFSSFKDFAFTRYAVRDFSDKPIDKKQVEDALRICEKSPSACNRQPWRIYAVFDKQKKDSLLKLQGGSRGFQDNIQGAILICCDMYCYGLGESNLPFVDGGIYAMNLMYALQSQGIANIPLTLSRHLGGLAKIKALLDIPANEFPVVLIGIGSFKDQYKAAVSQRWDYKEYVQFV